MTDRVWPVRDALDWTVGYLTEHGDEHPRRSAEWLLSAATGLSRIELYAQHDRPLSDVERAAFREGVRTRAGGEPLQYVTGEVAFRHAVLHVRAGVFIPRPETEVLVDEALRRLEGIEAPVVVDLCTGSGAVAISIATECPVARVYATELVPLSATVAAQNAARTGAGERLTVLEGDLFAPLPVALLGQVDLVVSNPPYIPTGDLPGLPTEVAAFEPHLALDGGADGLDVVRRIAAEALRWLRPGGVLVMETDTSMAKEAAKHLSAWYEGVGVLPDLTGRDRIVVGHTRKE